MVSEQPRPVFFVHIQKTSGGTLRNYLRDNLPRGAIYPEGGFDVHAMDSYWEIDRLRAITPERRRTIQAYVGHFPFVASELVPDDVLTVAVLRDPIERTISYLKMRSRDPGHRAADRTYEEIYEDGFDFPCFIHNHQTKIFSMTLDDRLETFMDVIDVDRDRLAIAIENLQKVDVLGLQEDSEEVRRRVGEHFGWESADAKDSHVSTSDWVVSESFRERIAEDNAIDLELYEFARSLVERRRAQRAG
jgi:hypothetical protein